MISKSVDLEFLQKHIEFEELIKETLDDRLLYIEGLEIIKRSQLYGLYQGDLLVGFYSLDDYGDCVEVHVYIFKSCRRYSLGAFRHIFAIQDKHIKTSVYGTHLHVVNFLKRLGFLVIGTLNDELVKNGKTYDVTELLYFQGD